MNLSTQKKMASDLLDCGKNKVKIDPKRQEDVGEAITKADIRRLIQEEAILKKDSKGQSKGKARWKKSQKDKGRRNGHGKRKGRKGSRQKKKEKWMNKVRAQRKFIKKLREEDKLEKSSYRNLYSKIKGGFFNSKKQLREWIKNNNTLKEGEQID